MLVQDEDYIKSSFKLGYITSILEYEFTTSKNTFVLGNLNYENRKREDETILLFNKDYKNIFGDDLELPDQFNSKNDFEEYLQALVNFIKDKISQEDSKIELSFFAGGAIALCFTNDMGVFAESILTSTIMLLFDWCGVPYYANLKEDISKIFSDNLYECMFARHQISHALIGNKLTPEQRKIFNNMDKAIVQKG